MALENLSNRLRAVSQRVFMYILFDTIVKELDEALEKLRKVKVPVVDGTVDGIEVFEVFLKKLKENRERGTWNVTVNNEGYQIHLNPHDDKCSVPWMLDYNNGRYLVTAHTLNGFGHCVFDPSEERP